MSVLLRSLLYQLLVDAPKSLFHHIIRVYQRSGETLTDSNNKLWGNRRIEIFKTLMNHPVPHEVHYIFYYLDECERW